MKPFVDNLTSVCSRYPTTGLGSRSKEALHYKERSKMLTGYIAELTKLGQNHPVILLGKVLLANGKGYHIKAVTPQDKFIKNISQSVLPSELIERIPIIEDYTNNNPPCERCKATGTELHHWAPRHLFEDADLWPQSYLCSDCHKRWHTVIPNHWRPGHAK